MLANSCLFTHLANTQQLKHSFGVVTCECKSNGHSCFSSAALKPDGITQHNSTLVRRSQFSVTAVDNGRQ